ncbi:MAG: hypothetical protein GY941_08815 [Planctomycetes bacterium]|nr:hypothetical protein [Planctomycetota bacterium]
MNESRVDIEERVKNVIMKTVKLSIDASKLKRDTSLVGKGLGLDSVSVTEVVVGLEEEFGLFFDDSELNVEIFENVGKLTNFINEKLKNENA